MAVKPVVYDDSTKKHRPLGSGEKMDGLSASSIISSQSGNLITTGSDGLAYATGSGIVDPAADNLLEATSGGKIRMDVDRLVEWLDGHPADAKTLSEAIKVVSGDSGNLIAKGSDKGAYMSSAQLAAALAGLTDAQLQSLAAAIADGQTIVASGGKLVVDPTNVTAAKLKKITAVLPKAQGGIVADSSTGKLYVDFDAMTPEFKRNLVLSMVDLQGGLAVHPSDAGEGKAGKIYVDFENMPTKQFEKLMAQLRMLIPLEDNKTVYVNPEGAGADDKDISFIGWGESRTGVLNPEYDPSDPSSPRYSTGPFETISGAVDYVTRMYSVGNFHITISVAEGTYEEHVALPDFGHGTGYIAIVPDSGDRDVIIRSPASSGGVPSGCISASGGTWRLENLHLVLTVSPVELSSYAARSVLGSGDKAVLSLYGIHFDQRVVAGAITGSTMDIRVCNADSGGTINLRHGSIPHKFSLSVADITGLSVEAIRCARGSDVVFYRTESDAVSHAVECSGSCTTFAYVTDNSNFHSVGTGSRLSFTGAVAGKRYTVSGGSYVNLGVGADYFPGNADGTVDNGADGRPQTYCWYN